MKYSYYPGCTLKTKAKELNDYAIASAKALGIEMEEIEDWQCCGGVYSTATDEITCLKISKENLLLKRVIMKLMGNVMHLHIFSLSRK